MRVSITLKGLALEERPWLAVGRVCGLTARGLKQLFQHKDRINVAQSL